MLKFFLILNYDNNKKDSQDGLCVLAFYLWSAKNPLPPHTPIDQ